MSASSSLSLEGSVSPLGTFPMAYILSKTRMLLDKRKEVLRLYREILRTTRMFPHLNEQGQPWSTVLHKNARMEIEQNRYETDGETISKRILFGWKCLQEVQEKMMEKQQELSSPDSDKKE